MKNTPKSSKNAHCTDCGLTLLSDGESCPRCEWDARTVHAASRTMIEAAAAGPPGVVHRDLRYQVLDTLGSGGMGIVYKVRDVELDEIVALKILRPGFTAGDQAVELFKHELKLARRINHPCVARLHDLFEWRGHLAICMEFVEGQPLEAIIRSGPLDIPTILHYLRCLCSGLRAAHKIGIVHRDLKPLNILIDTTNQARILDFGVAHLVNGPRAEDSKYIIGTPWYMSPEQIVRPHEADHRSDLYSLGIVLYQMVTGRVPFPVREPAEAFAAHVKQPPPPPRQFVPDLPEFLEKTILKCLRKNPSDRFQSAADLYASIDERYARRHPADVPAQEQAPAIAQGRAEGNEVRPASARPPHADPFALSPIVLRDPIPDAAPGVGSAGAAPLATARPTGYATTPPADKVDALPFPDRRKSPGHRRPQNPTALLVDDDKLSRQIVADILKKKNIRVLEAANGFEGIEMALSERPHIIFLDLVMPVIDGREALRILKANPLTSEIPVAMVTALTDPEESIFSRETGAAVTLNKPIEEDILGLLVDRYLG